MRAGGFTLLDRGGCVADLRLRGGVSCVSDGRSLWMVDWRVSAWDGMSLGV